MNESLESGIISLDSSSIQGVDFTSISLSEQQHIKIWKSPLCAWPWLQCGCGVMFEMPITAPFFLNWNVQLSNPQNVSVSFSFALLLLSFSKCVSTSAFLKAFRRFFGGDLSDGLGSAAYISCQRWELCVFPDQSEACLSSWSALNMFASAGGSTGWFCLPHCCWFVTRKKRLFISRGID